MRPVLVRTALFFAVVALPTVLFDLVYWQAPLPAALVTPTEVALRLTLVAFVTALVERRRLGAALPLAVFLAAFVTYALGFVESEYLNAVLRGHTVESGLQGLAALKTRLTEHPRYFALVLTIVATPFALASVGRARRLTPPLATLLSGMGTLVVVVFLLEPFRVEVGRVTAAFVCVRTFFCGLLLPTVSWIAEHRFERREVLKPDPE